VVVVGKRGPKPRTPIPQQPFGLMLIADGRSLTGVARRLGFDPGYVMRVSRGATAPTDEFKQAISEFMGQPVEALFTPEALAARYHAKITGRARRVGGKS
jgi:transcriptional regulator with XRE-family HTH domain